MTVRAHVLVKGLVQGVGFRFYALHQAESLGVIGFVRNLYSGDVEIEAEGDRSLIEEFIKRMKIGPRAAHVSSLIVEWIDCVGSPKRFEVQ